METVKVTASGKKRDERSSKNVKKSAKLITSSTDDHETSLITEKRLYLRDLRHQQEKLSKEHATVKEVLQKKQAYFSLNQKKHNEEQAKMIKEYEQALKDNQDRQIILEEKIKNKEQKIKSFDEKIKQYKIIIEKLREDIKKANSEIETRENSLAFLTKFKNESIEFEQLDMFDRLETIFNSEKLIKKKKEELNDKISNIKSEMKNMEEQNNIMFKNKENEYKNLIKLSEEVTQKKKKLNRY